MDLEQLPGLLHSNLTGLLRRSEGAWSKSILFPFFTGELRLTTSYWRYGVDHISWFILGFASLPIEGFYVTSYQANFASHHSRDRHVSFLLAYYGIGKHNKMSRDFYLVHTTIPNYGRVTRVLANTFGKFEFF